MRQIATSAIGYWEPRRILYNLVLAAIVVGQFYSDWPESRPLVTFDSVLTLIVLAVVANLLYCAAYFVDVFAQLSDYRASWLRWRWLLLVGGTAFAAMLTRTIAVSFFAVNLTN